MSLIQINKKYKDFKSFIEEGRGWAIEQLEFPFTLYHIRSPHTVEVVGISEPTFGNEKIVFYYHHKEGFPSGETLRMETLSVFLHNWGEEHQIIGGHKCLENTK